MMLDEKQKAYVKDSLTRAIREMKVAKIEGRNSKVLTTLSMKCEGRYLIT